MPITPEAGERAMRVHEVILRGLRGELTWLQVADILGRRPRSIRRAALAVRTPRLRRPVRRAAGEALTAPGAGGRGGADPAAVPRALPRLQRPALLSDRPAGARGGPKLHVRQTAAPARGLTAPAPRAGAASAAPGAAAVFRRVAAPGR